MRRYGYFLSVLLLVSAVLIGGCGGKSGSGDGASVSMKNMLFAPRELKVATGTTVTWTNEDVLDHAVSQGDINTPGGKSLFKSGDFSPGKTYEYTFQTPGTYPIYCSTPGHAAAGMVMTVVVGN